MATDGAPPGLKFTAIDALVMRGNQTIARACSNNFAQRIANSLNKYVPGRGGK